MHTNTMTNSRRKKQTHPSTRSSGFISSFKLPSGGSSSPSAWYLAYHAADGTSHCRCAPHVFPRTPSHPSTLPALPFPSCLQSFLTTLHRVALFGATSRLLRPQASYSHWAATYSGTRTEAGNSSKARTSRSPTSCFCPSRRNSLSVCTSSCTSTNGRCGPGPCARMGSWAGRTRCWDGHRCSLAQSRSADIVAAARLGSVWHIISWCVISSHDWMPAMGGY